jgi:hypothetical protein
MRFLSRDSGVARSPEGSAPMAGGVLLAQPFVARMENVNDQSFR